MLHRDVKPGNLLIHTDPTGATQARVCDFGMSVLTDEERLKSAGITVLGMTRVAGDTHLGTTSGTINWADGDADPKSLEFSIVDDGAGEADEFFELTLNNAIGANVAAQSTLRIVLADGSGVNSAPNAIAGASQTVNSGAVVILNGSASNDSDGDALIYQWSQITGVVVTIVNATSASATFTAPTVSSDQLLRFELMVSDGVNVNSASTSVTVRRSGNGLKKGGGSLGWLMLLALLTVIVTQRRLDQNLA